MPSDQSDNHASQDGAAVTTQQLLREISSLKDVIYVRLEAMDRAIVIFQEGLTRTPTETQKAVGTLRELVEENFLVVEERIKASTSLTFEKFQGVQKQFELRDIGVKETANLTNLALVAALTASEKAVQKQNEAFAISSSKTELSFTKQLDTQTLAVQALAISIADKVNDLKDRVGAMEGRSGGMSSLYGWIIGAVGLLFSGIAVVIAFVVYLSHSNAPAIAPIVIPK